MRQAIEASLPQAPDSGIARRNFGSFSTELLALAARPRLLVVGGGEGGAGFDVIRHSADRFHLIESDVRVTSKAHLVCDAHQLPFADSSLHGVVIQAVLEHVLDPFACVAEIHRVLVPGGLVYAETPFMQQVHMGRHDFTRFTYLGHRRLFRWFEQISAGAVCGPGAAVRWSLDYYVRSATSSRELRWLGGLASRMLSWPLEQFDPWLLRSPRAWDAASALFFLGRRSAEPLSDHALLESYPSS
jgi:SAM-dependent methyltransferase